MLILLGNCGFVLMLLVVFVINYLNKKGYRIYKEYISNHLARKRTKENISHHLYVTSVTRIWQIFV